MALLVDRPVHFRRLLSEEELRSFTVRGQRIDESLIQQILDSQSRRMEDQRTPLPVDPQEESFLSLLTKIQSKRMEDQRASLHLEATINPSPRIGSARVESVQSEDEFIDLVFRCQSSRINDQRSLDPETYWRNLMPGEDFFNLLQHLQSTRIEDQRSPFPSPSH